MSLSIRLCHRLVVGWLKDAMIRPAYHLKISQTKGALPFPDQPTPFHTISPPICILAMPSASSSLLMACVNARNAHPLPHPFGCHFCFLLGRPTAILQRRLIPASLLPNNCPFARQPSIIIIHQPPAAGHCHPIPGLMTSFSFSPFSSNLPLPLPSFCFLPKMTVSHRPD